MYKPQNSEVNPYAPPMAHVAGHRIPRPASSWWTLFIVGLDAMVEKSFVSFFVLSLSGRTLEGGDMETQEVEVYGAADFAVWGFFMVAIILLLIGWRSKWTYFFGGSALLWTTCGNIEVLFRDWRESKGAGVMDLGVDFLFFLTISGLLGYLTVKFLTGISSRRYYRMVPQ